MTTIVTPLVLGSDLPGRPIVAIDCGDDIAEVRDVIFDPVSHRLVGFTLNKRGWFRGTLKEALPRDSIRAIGPFAIMVDSTASLVERGEAAEKLDMSSSNFSVIGANVLSAGGDELGTVSDIVFETGPTPQATGYQVTTDDGAIFVPISAQLALSGDNLVLPESATSFIRNDLAGFGASVADYRHSLEESA